jgi:hypothetical protein
MSLHDAQNFLARIYTDENLRREFLSAPEQTGRENNLSEKEIAELAAIFPAELNFFAESLIYKRLRAVEKLLPLTGISLKGNFESCFREFANQYAPESSRKHLEDALRFAEFLQTKKIELVWVADLAKYERAKLEFNVCQKRFIFRIFDYDIKEISRNNAAPQGKFFRKKTFAAWFRFGRQTRHYIW